MLGPNAKLELIIQTQHGCKLWYGWWLGCFGMDWGRRYCRLAVCGICLHMRSGLYAIQGRVVIAIYGLRMGRLGFWICYTLSVNNM